MSKYHPTHLGTSSEDVTLAFGSSGLHSFEDIALQAPEDGKRSRNISLDELSHSCPDSTLHVPLERPASVSDTSPSADLFQKMEKSLAVQSFILSNLQKRIETETNIPIPCSLSEELESSPTYSSPEERFEIIE